MNVGDVMELKDYMKNGNCDNFYEGDNILLNEEEILIGTDEYKIEKENKILLTTDLHYCISMLVIGDSVGMSHLEIKDNLSSEQREIIDKLLKIENISEINIFLGPNSDLEKVKKIFSEIEDKITFYASYIDNTLGIDVATGNIAYSIKDKKLYGKNDDGYVEYKKGYINLKKVEEFQNIEENLIDKKK